MDIDSKKNFIRETIEDNFEDFTVHNIKKLGEGWMSNAYLLNDEYVFRFPKEKEGNVDLEKEIKALPILREKITLQIPNFEYVGKQINGFKFVGYKILKGKILDKEEFNILSSDIKSKLANQIANFMNEINLVQINNYRNFNVCINDFYVDYMDTFSELKEKVFPIFNIDLQYYITRKFEEYLNNRVNFNYIPKLIHADLSLNHMLYNEERREFTGIIDFGDMHIGDPDFDYVYLLDDCGIDFTKEVMKLRKQDDIESRLRKVSFFLTVDNVGIVLEGIRISNKRMIEDGIKTLREEMEINISI